MALTAVRRFGLFELRALLGRSARVMAWLAWDPRSSQELTLVLPRRQPATDAALADWLGRARRAARLAHPHLAHAVEVGEQEHWPFIAYDRAMGSSLAEREARQGESPLDIARWIAQAASGLAFAHDAGHSHRDLQPWLLVLSPGGDLRVMGLEVALPHAGDWQSQTRETETAASDLRQASRAAGERDVLALAVVMHGLLAGAPALDEPDIGAALARLAPEGREPIRLPWDLPRPVPDVLRAIANRATDRHTRQRYRNSRTLARALEGFLEVESAQGGSTYALLIERVRQIGALPALRGAAQRAARLAMMEREHTEELAQVVLRDPALTFELLRTVNSAQVRGTQVSGNGPVLTVRRAIAMLGLEGVRHCALGLRQWPGPLDEGGARDLEQTLALAQRAARLAQVLRPAGYDAEMVRLVALLQNLGRLVVQYHFPDEMRQLRRLMQPLPSTVEGEPEDPGLTEQAAAHAVLGGDIEAMGLAVARWWGMDDAVIHMLRRLPLALPVRAPVTDDDMLRLVGSAANEAVDVVTWPPERQAAAIERVAQRYARTLELNARDLMAALQDSARASPRPATDETVADDATAGRGVERHPAEGQRVG